MLHAVISFAFRLVMMDTFRFSAYSYLRQPSRRAVSFQPPRYFAQQQPGHHGGCLSFSTARAAKFQKAAFRRHEGRRAASFTRCTITVDKRSGMPTPRSHTVFSTSRCLDAAMSDGAAGPRRCLLRYFLSARMAFHEIIHAENASMTFQ